MDKELEEKWYNSFSKEQLIERSKYLQRSCDRKESLNFDLEMEISRLNSIINDIRKDLEVIEQSENIDTIKMNLRTIIYKLERVDKE